MVLTFGHSGVKFVTDRVLSKQDEYSEVYRMRDKLLKREVLQQEQLALATSLKLTTPDSMQVKINPLLKKQATKMGELGLQHNLLLYDDIKKEEK